MKKLLPILFLLFFISVSAQSLFEKYSPHSLLPVEIDHFDAVLVGDTVHLTWGTATEVNNFGFQVQRSVDSLNWDNIGFVLGAGTSNSPKSYEYYDYDLPDFPIIYYRLKQVDNDGNFEYSWVEFVERVTSVSRESAGGEINFKLFQNYPNPFSKGSFGNPTTKISFSIPQTSFVNLYVSDIQGKTVKILMNRNLSQGKYSINFDASGFSSGIYFYHLITEKVKFTKKMILLK